MDRDLEGSKASKKDTKSQKQSHESSSRTQQTSIPNLMADNPKDNRNHAWVDVDHEFGSSARLRLSRPSSGLNSTPSSTTAGAKHSQELRTGQGSKRRTKTDDYRCPECLHVTSSAASLQDHASRQHKSKVYPCKECCAVFCEKGNLNRHIKSVQNQKSDAEVRLNPLRLRHVHVFSRNERPWICPHCGLTFSFKDSLNRHYNAVHKDLRPFPCSHCSMSFKKKDHLKRHQQTVCTQGTPSSGKGRKAK